jgi:hypothetical protein
MTEGSESGSMSLTNGSGSGSRRPKNIRIRNTDRKSASYPEPADALFHEIVVEEELGDGSLLVLSGELCVGETLVFQHKLVRLEALGRLPLRHVPVLGTLVFTISSAFELSMTGLRLDDSSSAYE